MNTADGYPIKVGDVVYIRNDVEYEEPYRETIGALCDNKILYKYPEDGNEGAKIDMVFKLEEHAYWHSVKITNEHNKPETWLKTTFFCPNCKGEVWKKYGDGDYYCGPTHLCLNCKQHFYISEGWASPDSEIVDKINRERLMNSY